MAMIAACGSSSADPRPLVVSFKGVRYAFPKEHLNASVIPPEGRLYVRLAPPSSEFHLILDEWGDMPSSHGRNVPRISRLSDSFGKVSVTETANGMIVCDLGPKPHFNCGFRLEDGSVKWAVLFDKRLLSQAGQIRESAIRTIATYKSAPST